MIFSDVDNEKTKPWDGLKGKPKWFLDEDYSWDSPTNTMKGLLSEGIERVLGVNFSIEQAKSSGFFVASPKGKLFHILQAPLYWEDGTKVERDENLISSIVSGLNGLNVFGGFLSGLVISGTTLERYINTNCVDCTLSNCIVYSSFNPVNIKKAIGTFFSQINSFGKKRSFIYFEGFVNCIIKEGINIQKAIFEKQVEIFRCRIEDNFGLYDCIFENELNLNFSKLNSTTGELFGSKLPDKINIVRCIFKARFYFTHSKFVGTFFNFFSCIFENEFTINNLKFGRFSSLRLLLNKCIFKGTTSLNTDEPLCPSFLLDCHFEKTFVYNKPKFENRRRQLLPNTEALKDPINSNLWERVEKCSQELRALAERNHEKHLSWTYYDLENIAKTKKTGVKFNIVAFAYEFFSMNGLSIYRPIISLISIWLVFSLIYSILTILPLIDRSILEFSWSVFLTNIKASASKMSILNLRDGEDYWKVMICPIKNHLFILTIMEFFAFVQNILSILLVFLLGLAIRRRYQL